MDQFKSAARSSTGTTAIFTEDANQSKALDQKPSRIGEQSAGNRCACTDGIC